LFEKFIIKAPVIFFIEHSEERQILPIDIHIQKLDALVHVTTVK